MAKVIILGSSNSIPDENHENTHLVIVGDEHTILVDCVSSPILRLRRAGIDYHQVTDLILTHFHPDHVSGVPLLLMDMWLLGRSEPLTVYGLDHTLERVERMMDFYDWKTWPNFFPVNFHRLPERNLTPVIQNSEFKVVSSPVQHLIPTIGLRFEFLQTGKTLAYSCDTEPCPAVVELAAGADILIHEATGNGLGHSSAEQAGQIAAQAMAQNLFLIHYPTGDSRNQSLLDSARKQFSGGISLSEDFQVLDFS